jgi:hypothetical protein
VAEAIENMPLLLDAKTVRRITGLTQNNLNYLANSKAIRTIVPGKRNRKYYKGDIVKLIKTITGE